MDPDGGLAGLLRHFLHTLRRFKGQLPCLAENELTSRDHFSIVEVVALFSITVLQQVTHAVELDGVWVFMANEWVWGVINASLHPQLKLGGISTTHLQVVKGESHTFLGCGGTVDAHRLALWKSNILIIQAHVFHMLLLIYSSPFVYLHLY